MENKRLENAIMDRELKEYFGDMAIALLTNHNLISQHDDLKNLVIEFGYLFLDSQNEPYAMFKIMLSKNTMQSQRTFYFGTQDGKLLLLNQQFTEDIFRSVQEDMFMMHGIDIENENFNHYVMELY